MRVPDGKPLLDWVKASTAVPPSAKGLSPAVTPAEVFQTVPRAEMDAFPSKEIVAPRVAVLLVTVETVGDINVGKTGVASPSPYKLMVQEPSSSSELKMVTTATFEPPVVGENRMTRSSKLAPPMVEDGKF
jgi:hypothetical protein